MTSLPSDGSDYYKIDSPTDLATYFSNSSEESYIITQGGSPKFWAGNDKIISNSNH